MVCNELISFLFIHVGYTAPVAGIVIEKIIESQVGGGGAIITGGGSLPGDRMWRYMTQPTQQQNRNMPVVGMNCLSNTIQYFRYIFLCSFIVQALFFSN